MTDRLDNSVPEVVLTNKKQETLRVLRADEDGWMRLYVTLPGWTEERPTWVLAPKDRLALADWLMQGITVEERKG